MSKVYKSESSSISVVHNDVYIAVDGAVAENGLQNALGFFLSNYHSITLIDTDTG